MIPLTPCSKAYIVSIRCKPTERGDEFRRFATKARRCKFKGTMNLNQFHGEL